MSQVRILPGAPPKRKDAMSGEISFFEIGVGDPEKAREFYGGLFGDWKFEPGPSGGGGYGISTGSTPGGLHGGDEGASLYAFFAVPDLDAALARVRELGGEGAPMDESADSAEEFGRFALCKDDQGSAFGLHQPPAG
jgi:predicted enzyme related to lactoylglutathione lyase